MSRTGKQLITIPDKVKVGITGDVLLAEGPLGKESVPMNPEAKVIIENGKVKVVRVGESKYARCVHGMIRSLINNAVTGVTKGFKRDLEINGVGFRAEVQGQKLNLTLGYSHGIVFDIPKGVKIVVDKQTKLSITGSNKEQVGHVAAVIRGFRPPEPYKGKGIKYAEEKIIRKVGKAAGGK